MKVKVSELTGAALDWAVCRTQHPDADMSATHVWLDSFDGEDDFLIDKTSTDWAQGGPILTRERISRTIDHSGLWIAYWTDGYTDGDEGKKWMQCDRSELIAGLRCYVASKLGNEVDIPDELANEGEIK